MSDAERSTGRLAVAACAALGALLCLLVGGADAATSPSLEADAASVEACLDDPAASGSDPRQCGERLVRQCAADAKGAGRAGEAALACEKRRGDAWNLIARKAYRRLEAKLGDADRHLLRTSQVQFELELRDLCTAARAVAAGDPDLAAASCISELVATRALILVKLAAGGAAPAR